MKLSQTHTSPLAPALPRRRFIASAICLAAVLTAVTIAWLASSQAHAAPASTLTQAPAQTGPVRAYFAPAASDDPNGVYLNLMKFLDTAKVSIHASAHPIIPYPNPKPIKPLLFPTKPH